MVCFDKTKWMQKHMRSSRTGRLGLVLVSLLWSLSVNCLVEIYMNTSRFWQVLTITCVDSCGRSVLNLLFIIVHLKCWSSIYYNLCSHHGANQRTRRGGRTISQQQFSEMIYIIFSVIFLTFFSAWLLFSMSPEQLYNSTYRCVILHALDSFFFFFFFFFF